MHKGSGSWLKGAGFASSTLPLPLFAIVRAIPPPDASVKRIGPLIMFGSMLGCATDVSARTLGHVIGRGNGGSNRCFRGPRGGCFRCSGWFRRQWRAGVGAGSRGRGL